MKYLLTILCGLLLLSMRTGSTHRANSGQLSDSTRKAAEWAAHEKITREVMRKWEEFVDSNKVDEGFRFLRNHVRKNPRAFTIRMILAGLLDQFGKTKESIRRFSDVIREYRKGTGGENDTLYTLRGQAYFHDGQFPKAFNDFVFATQINPDNMEARLMTAKAYMRMEMADFAIVVLTKAIARAPENLSEFYMERAFAFAQIGDSATACQDYYEALHRGFSPDEATKKICPQGEK